jgi:hypothetical protein
VSVSLNGAPVTCAVAATARSTEPACDVAVADSASIAVTFRQPPELVLPPLDPRRGDRSRAVRLVDLRAEGDSVAFTLEGPAGTTVSLDRVGGGVPVAVTFPEPGDSVDGYSRADLRLARH